MAIRVKNIYRSRLTTLYLCVSVLIIFSVSFRVTPWLPLASPSATFASAKTLSKLTSLLSAQAALDYGARVAYLAEKETGCKALKDIRI